MRRARAACCLATGLLLALLTGCGDGASPSDLRGTGPAGERAGEQGVAGRDWSKDSRIVGLVEDCANLGTFAGDTSDLLPVLVSKLERGSMSVMHNVREELAREGAVAIPEVVRLVRRLYTEPHGSHPTVNALGVLQLSEAGSQPEALELMRDCLGHPQSTVQAAAVQALGRHADAAAYDDLLSLMRVSHDTMRNGLIIALHHADERRFERELAQWIRTEQYPGQWEFAARLVARTANEDTGALYAEIAADVAAPVARAFLLSTLVGREGSRAEELLVELLDDPDSRIRGYGLAALEYTDLTALAAKVLRNDEAPSLRAMSVGLLAAHIDEPASRAALRDGLNDEDEGVRGGCLAALLAAGDEAAADFAISYLRGPQRDLQTAVSALTDNWEANPGLAQRVFDTLTALIEERAAQPLAELTAYYQALGQIPGPASTEYLLQAARKEGGTHQSMSAHRWLTIHASNTGAIGRAVLAQAWSDEADLERRMDYLWAATVGHDAQTSAFLKQVLMAERSAPHERLYVADRLAHEGPAAEVAPLIKRAMMRMSDPIMRPAMNCLLWRWYGRG